MANRKVNNLADKAISLAIKMGHICKFHEANTGTIYLMLDGEWKIRIANHQDAHENTHLDATSMKEVREFLKQLQSEDGKAAIRKDYRSLRAEHDALNEKWKQEEKNERIISMSHLTDTQLAERANALTVKLNTVPLHLRPKGASRNWRIALMQYSDEMKRRKVYGN